MNCLESSPLIFRIFTHSIHFVSLPTYFLALFSLVSIKSKVFVTYRYFLLWHVLENLFFEMHSDFLVAPAVHPPFCAIRATGILSQIGMSSLVQFYWLSLAIQFFDTFLAILTSQDAYRFQEEHKATFLKQDPSAHFLTCDNVYLFVPFADYISTTIIILWIVECIVLFLSIPGTAIFINLSISKSASESTWKIQKNLLKSLVIQASIHSIMMGVPNGMFNYAFFFGYENESLAYGAFVILTYHGFVSTFALIIFTKPLREYLLIAFKMKKTATQKVSMTSLHKRTSVF
ncbi:Serpentine Receptor, class H [Caenorhabditis elegans]|uniref:Serpentine Receptor, class H n=1 Tax=Caenorhabditis elegans TaxID=6239 RepID=O16431_CAEEL|nr:Serpentine Receptor, class H [Caenorhabditis elegans]CCD62593.1 Serpentine Receptor, class H [Caenorhabditis elegans]|eukprot:NP_001256055.1 Serpentine Receptor, class H [Caenorhabditis elegans]